jgi:hypothetical protein
VDEDRRRSNGAGERWLDWLAHELVRRQAVPGMRLMVLWEVVEDWFASDQFDGRIAATLIGGADLPGPGHPAHAIVAANRLALRRLLEELAAEVRALDPPALALQLQMLFEGAIVGALVDRQPEVARVAGQLAVVALAASGQRGGAPEAPAEGRQDACGSSAPEEGPGWLGPPASFL